MGFLASVFRAEESPGRPSPDDDYWYQPVGSESDSGIAVTPEGAMKLSAAYACVKVISETVASLPCVVYRRLDNGGKERVRTHRVQRLLNRPNQFQTRFEFFELLTRAFAMRGNGIGEIIPGPSGFADQILPRHPSRVRAQRLASGRIGYWLRGADGVEKPVLSESILHVRGASDDGVWGLSPIEEGAQTIGRGLAQQRFGATFFRNGARPSGVLKHPETMSPEAEKHLVRTFQAAHTGTNAGRVALLQEGMTYEKITMTAEEAQFLQSEQQTVEDVARYYRMPLPKIGHMLRTNYSTAEQMGLWFVTDTIAPVCSRIEQVFNRDLFLETEQDEFFCEFLMEGLLRGDAAARSTFYHGALTDGWMTRNEVRMRENLNTLDGLDVPFVQLNMGPGNSGGTPAPIPAPAEKDEP